MDRAGLTILLQELQADSAVAGDAGRKAALRLQQKSPGHLEACAYELARFYNVLEKMLERLHLEGIRPAFIPHGRAADIRELKGFRHITRHAYDLTLREDRLTELARITEQISEELPGWCTDFVAKVRAQEGWQN